MQASVRLVRRFTLVHRDRLPLPFPISIARKTHSLKTSLILREGGVIIATMTTHLICKQVIVPRLLD